MRSLSSSWFWSTPRIGDTVPVLYYLAENDRLMCEPGNFLDRWLLSVLTFAIGAALLIKGKPVNV